MVGFARDYEVEVLPGLPGVGGVHPFAPQGVSIHAEGYVVRVITTSGASWIGNFQRGDGKLSTWAPTPSPSALLVVAYGTGYVVAVDQPATYRVLPCYPIRYVVPVVSAGLLVIADYNRVAASDGSGIRWVSDRVAWDDLEIDELDEQKIRGHSYDPESGGTTAFVLDTRSGRLVEGRAVRA